MKCIWLQDTDTNPSTLSESEKLKVAVRVELHRTTGEPREAHYFPKGTEHEHPEAYKFVNFGMARPADEECEKACTRMSPEDRKRLEKRYAAAARGIHDPADVQLFMDDVILGYESVNGQLAYIAGPSWGDRASKLKEEKAKEESDI